MIARGVCRGSWWTVVAGAALAGTAGCGAEEPVSCGEGTVLEDGVCVGTGGLACGPGTHADGDVCVPDDGTRYELRVESRQISATGYARIPVLALGTRPDGTPADDEIVLATSRAGAGSFVEPAAVLGPFGATARYVSCSASAAGCTGPAQLTLALARDPATILARVDIDLIEPPVVGSIAPCLTGAASLHFEGDDHIVDGTLTITEASWSTYAEPALLSISVIPAEQSQGAWWALLFSTAQLEQALAPGVYEAAQHPVTAGAGEPGLDISGNGRGCAKVAGRYQVHALERDATDQIARAVVSFEQRCDGGAKLLRGCVRYEP